MASARARGFSTLVAVAHGSWALHAPGWGVVGA